MDLKVLLVLCTVIISPASAKLTITDQDGVVEAAFNNVVIFSHSATSPVAGAGSGTATIEESTGNFDITEDITSSYMMEIMTVTRSETNGATFIASSTEILDVEVTITIDVNSYLGEDFLTIEASLTAPDNSSYNRLTFRFYATENEKVYGAGEQFTYFNLRNYTFPIWSREQGVGRDGVASATEAGGSYDTTYWPQASFMSDKKYSLFIRNYEYLDLDFSNATYHEVYIHSTSLTANMYTADTVLDLISSSATKEGLPRNLPDWILSGSILGVEEGTDQMMNYYQLAKDYGINVSAMWIQDWSGKIETDFGYRVYWNWKWNSTLYPDLDEKIIELQNDGVKIAVYCNPHLIVGSELYLEAEELGYLMTDADGNAFQQDFRGFYAGTVDIHSSAAATWYKNTLKTNIPEFGFAAWMADFGEYTRTDMYSKNTDLSQEEVHNKLPVKWAEINSQMVTQSSASDTAVYFMRSGATGSAANQMLGWAGDQNVDFSIEDGVASTIVAALGLGVSGMGVTHFDIGGYTTLAPLITRSEELFLRSAEYAVFTPVMRTHLGNDPEANHQFYTDELTLSNFARLTQIHSTLYPYTRDLVDQNALEGIPVQRPMFLHFEDDPVAWDIMYQYMYGPDLIVTPVIEKGQVNVEIYIPKGDDAQWFDLFTGNGPYVGPTQITLFSPIGTPAVLYRNDSSFFDIFMEITEKYGVARV